MTHEKMPARYVVHHDPHSPGRWDVHPKDSPYCGVTNPGWAGREGSGCLGLSTPSWSDAIAEAHKRSTYERVSFLRRMMARGRQQA